MWRKLTQLPLLLTLYVHSMIKAMYYDVDEALLCFKMFDEI